MRPVLCYSLLFTIFMPIMLLKNAIMLSVINHSKLNHVYKHTQNDTKLLKQANIIIHDI